MKGMEEPRSELATASRELGSAPAMAAEQKPKCHPYWLHEWLNYTLEKVEQSMKKVWVQLIWK
jgi:hypothetical protein